MSKISRTVKFMPQVLNNVRDQMSFAVKILIFSAGLVMVWTANSQERSEDFSGLWQFPNTGVWIDIRPDGKAFQCRIDTDYKTTYTSSGLVTGNTVEWQNIWGTEKIDRKDHSLVLDGKFGKFSFVRSRLPMAVICQSPLPKLSLQQTASPHAELVR